MKYRILEQGCFYTPQYKKFFSWENFRTLSSFSEFHFPISNKVVFSDLYGAKQFLDEKIKEKQSAKSPKVHNYP